MTYSRIKGFLRKECLQIYRDPSSILLALAMPLVLLFLFGYGISLNPENSAIAIVVEHESSASRDITARFDLSRYFTPYYYRTIQEASRSPQNFAGILRIPADFTKTNSLQLLLNGTDSNQAQLIKGYIKGTLGEAAAREKNRRGVRRAEIELVPRVWFNQNIESHYFIVPGLLALIMTIIGTLLTALVIAREWERGTMENILATPLLPSEFLMGKIIPYFILGLTGMAITTIFGIVVFTVPFRGSFTLLLLFGSLFLAASMGLGLLISVVAKVQFVAAMAGILAGFLPALFLSGLLFDLASTPQLIQAISVIIPAKYFVSIAQTLFLAGNSWQTLLPAALALAIMALLLLILVRLKISRRLP